MAEQKPRVGRPHKQARRLEYEPVCPPRRGTAALDPINEAAMQRGFRALTRHKTLVVVAYRLQTVRAADRILVLDG